MYDTLPHPRVASVELLRLETIHFQNACICKTFCAKVCTDMHLHWKPLPPHRCSCLAMATGLIVNTEHTTSNYPYRNNGYELRNSVPT